MAHHHQQDLVQIGLEGFDIIDTYYPPNRVRRSSPNGGFMATSTRQRPPAARWLVQATHEHHHNKEERVINSKDAASKYGGIMVVNYPNNKTKSKSFWGKIFNL
ncbi:hypothetical protein HN51_065591 [Arachis hypogaea]|nr:uncharacterized protein DS421_14g457660 [Arachis hypogaea]